MRGADVSIAKIASDCRTSAAKVLSRRKPLGILPITTTKRLALEDTNKGNHLPYFVRNMPKRHLRISSNKSQ